MSSWPQPLRGATREFLIIQRDPCMPVLKQRNKHSFRLMWILQILLREFSDSLFVNRKPNKTKSDPSTCMLLPGRYASAQWGREIHNNQVENRGRARTRWDLTGSCHVWQVHSRRCHWSQRYREEERRDKNNATSLKASHASQKKQGDILNHQRHDFKK